MGGGASKRSKRANADATANHDSTTNKHDKGNYTNKPSDNPADSNDDSAKPENSDDEQATKPIYNPVSISNPEVQDSKSQAQASKDDPIFWAYMDKKTIKLNGDMFEPVINGCCFMPNGDLLLCDGPNQRVKRYDNKTGVNSGTLFVQSCPFDVAPIDEATAIATVPRQKMLVMVKMTSYLQKGSTIAVDKECWGIDVTGDKIYVACCTEGKDDGEICIYGLFGSKLNSFYTCNTGSIVLKSPKQICVNKFGSKLFVTDPETDTVLCITTDGKLIYEYRHGDLKNPHGICEFENDKVFVCGYGSGNVQAIDADGKTDKTLLWTHFIKPLSITYRQSDEKIAVGGEGDEMIYVNKGKWSM